MRVTYSRIRSSGPTDLQINFWDYFRHNIAKIDPHDLNTGSKDACRDSVQSAIKISLQTIFCVWQSYGNFSSQIRAMLLLKTLT